jgi:hypothetical protein
MNTAELDSYRLADAVKFNKQLNPRLWQGNRMLPQVREKLLEIAADFKQSLGLSDLEVKDITVSGSNAGFTYTPHSDIDLHLVVDIPQADTSDVYRELFDAKKYQYNAEHNITIGGHDVELYVENANVPPVSQGVYSIMQDDWINIPKRRRSTVNDDAVRSKYADIKHRIQQALASKDHEQISAMAAKIKKMRTAGLAQSGELGPENLAYKMLRTQGLIKQLYDARTAARDLELSLNERRKKKKQVRYGFWSPGFSFSDSGDGGGGESIQEVSVTPDGVSPSTKMFLEQDSAKDTDILKSFAQYVKQELGIQRMPKIRLKRRPEWAEQNGSFGQYVPELNELTLSLHGRHIVDVLRTLAHELTHAHQQQTTGIPNNGGDTGSKFENEANARAGEFMRHFADAHPEYFDSRPLEEGMVKNAGAAVALATAMAMTPAQAQQYLSQDQQQQVQQQGQLTTMQILNIARTIHSLKHNLTRAGAEEEINQEVKNYIRATQGDPGAQNLSRVWQLQQRQQQRQQPQQQPWTGNQYQREGIVEASGYIPTDAEKNDPRFVMALSPDVQPGATGKNANKMALKTDSQGRPQIAQANGLVESLAREFEQFDESTALFEIKMTGKNLRAEAAKTGAQAGMEFEMIVPNTEVDVEPEYEPDWDQDQRTRSFRDIRDFFHDGDYNGRRAVDDLMEELANEYEEWQMEKISEVWNQEGVDYIRDFVEVNDLFDRSETLDQARDEVMTANPDLPPDSEDFQQLINARINELQEQFVLDAFEEQGRVFTDAFEAFTEEQREEYDESSFLDDTYSNMTDIQSNFDISWPHYYDINDGQDGEMDIDQVADDFSNFMGKPVNASRQYHGARREAGHYVVEPDGSLEGDNPGDGGLEFVSPPMPIDEMISDLNKVKEWAGQNGCYTNDSTGLHINISVPDYSIDKLDYVKLAILMGDEYILDLFGRSGNTYAKSAMGKIKSALKQKPEAAAQIMDLMKQGLNGAATKAIHTGITDKYTSINTKTGYIEFRSPGGDWLDSNFANIENTLLRFTVALSAAINPEAYRKEYLTKLYKLLSEGMDKSDVDVIQLFSNYSAGELDKPALIRQVRQKQLARNVAKGKATGKMWWSVSRPGYMASIEVVADNAEEAIASAILPGNYPDWASARNTLQAKPVRPYEVPTAKAAEPAADNQGNWGIWIRANDRFANQPGSYSRSETPPLMRFPSRAAAEQWIEQQRTTRPNMRSDIEVREIEPAIQDTGSATSGNWGIWVPVLDRWATMNVDGQSVTRRFTDRARANAWIQDYNARNPRSELELTVQEIEPGADTNINYEIYNRETGEVVDTTQLRNDDEAQIRLDDYRAHGPHRLNTQDAIRTFGMRRGPGVTNTQTDTNPLSPSGPGPWEVASRNNNQVYYNPPSSNPIEAESQSRTWLRQNDHNEADFEVRTREGVGNTDNWSSDFERRMQAGTADAAQGGIIDIEPDISQYTAPQTLTRPGQGQQQFTGTWLVLDPNGRELHRFSGIGNVQADANRIAINWLRAHPGAMQAGVTVAPEMA